MYIAKDTAGGVIIECIYERLNMKSFEWQIFQIHVYKRAHRPYVQSHKAGY